MEREAFQKDVFISMSHCAYDARMDISALATLCADLATEHAERLGIGTKLVREKGIFWMTARTQLRIHRAPALGEGVLARTWIESLRGAHSVRCYRLVQKEELLAEGRTTYVGVNVRTGAPTDLEAALHCQAFERGDMCCADFPERMQADIAQMECLGERTVRSIHIDLGGHMNNAMYPKMLLSAFSCHELQALGLRRADFWFRKPCMEGETLRVMRSTGASPLQMALLKKDETPALLAELRT